MPSRCTSAFDEAFVFGGLLDGILLNKVNVLSLGLGGDADVDGDAHAVDDCSGRDARWSQSVCA